jgi:hypothetical protein
MRRARLLQAWGDGHAHQQVERNRFKRGLEACFEKGHPHFQDPEDQSDRLSGNPEGSPKKPENRKL